MRISTGRPEASSNAFRTFSRVNGQCAAQNRRARHDDRNQYGCANPQPLPPRTSTSGSWLFDQHAQLLAIEWPLKTLLMSMPGLACRASVPDRQL